MEHLILDYFDSNMDILNLENHIEVEKVTVKSIEANIANVTVLWINNSGFEMEKEASVNLWDIMSWINSRLEKVEINSED